MKKHHYISSVGITVLLLFTITLPTVWYIYFNLYNYQTLSLTNLFNFHKTHPFIFILDIALILNVCLSILSIYTISNTLAGNRITFIIRESKKLLNLTNHILNGSSRKEVFNILLHDLLELTNSEFGFIGEVIEDARGVYLKTYNITDIAWDKSSKDLYRPEGMEFRNLDTLFGEVLRTGEHIISNNPASDNRSGGLPPGHPPITSFLGIALKKDNQFIGMIGLANNVSGYKKSIIDSIALYINACTNTLWNEKLIIKNLAKNKEFLTTISSMSDGFVMINQHSVIESVNNALLDIFGYTESELTGQNITILMDAVSQIGHLQGIKQYFETGKKQVLNNQAVKVTGLNKKGQPIPLEITVNELTFGGETKFIGVVRDITDKIKINESLENLLNEQKMIIDTANAPILGIDKNGSVNEWNKMSEIISGYQKYEVIGRHLVNELISIQDRKTVEIIFDEAMQGIGTDSFEFNLNTKSGYQISILANASTRLDSKGNIVGAISIGQDITQLNKKNAELQQAQKLESLGLLTGGIAHDFNNLLAVILGNLDYLSDNLEIQSDEIIETIDDAISAAKDGAELTSALLLFAKGENLKLTVTDVNYAIEKLSRIIERSIDKSISLALTLTESNPKAFLDSTQFDAALLNLCMNSADAMRENGHLTISTGIKLIEQENNKVHTELNQGEYIEIIISDDGIGMDQEELEHIFEPFYSNKNKGTGLGLSMVYGFVTKSKGKIFFESQPGLGTTATILLPRIFMEPDQPTPHDDHDRNFLNNYSVLIVDDVKSMRSIAKRIFTKIGIKTNEAGSAHEALDFLATGEKVDILFSDIVMPGPLTGRDLARIVERRYPDIKILLTSGYEEESSISINHQEEQYPLLKKPFRKSQLIQEIQRLVET